MELHVYKNQDEFSHAVADWIIEFIQKTLSKQDRCCIALSGGNTPRALYELLAASPRKEKIRWELIHVFWGDERDVPFEDERNNAKMAFETLLNHVPVPASQIHVMRTDIAPEQSAAEYEKILYRYFPAGPEGKVPRSFDLVLLGMGEDGHTLSLFPGMPIVHEEKKWADAFFLPAQNMYRITLTKTVVNLSSCVAFLTTGSNKAHALQQVLKGSYQPDLYPSQVIRPLSGELHWFVDKAAASAL
ncbi:MAG TPA: 6-phosphogluconolactonase [Puia sp.]|nr:6-phosphogluconolactonase [Puia sp.]